MALYPQNQAAVANTLDKVRDTLKLKNDAALARALDVQPPVVSKLRSGALPVGASLLLRLHDLVGMSIAELKASISLPA